MQYCERLRHINSLLPHFCSHETLDLLSSEGALFRYRLLNKFALAIRFATGFRISTLNFPC